MLFIMVGRGMIWASGPCLGFGFVACSAPLAPGDGAAGEGGESEVGGGNAYEFVRVLPGASD